MKREISFSKVYGFQGRCKVGLDACDLIATTLCLVLAILNACSLQCWSIDCCCRVAFFLVNMSVRGLAMLVF